MKALVFTYYWPPSGGPAVQRWLSLCNLLPSLGIDLQVITVNENKASYALIDNSLVDEIPPSLQVYKTNTFEPFGLYSKWVGKGKIPTAGFANEEKPGTMQLLARWIRGNLFIPDPRKGWNPYALKQARSLIEKENINLIITAGPPHSTHLIGLALQKEFRLPWVADFHDAWTGIWYYNKLLKSSIARRIDSSLEQTVLLNAQLVLTVGRQLQKSLRAKLINQNPEKVVLHSMGFNHAMLSKKVQLPKQEFVITYTGTIALNYEPQAVFEAIEAVQSQHKDAVFKVRLIGLIAPEIASLAKSIFKHTQLEVVAYLPHQQSLDALFSSCVLLLLNPNTPQAADIIPGKIYEYMATRLPILNLGEPNSETFTLISENNAGKSFTRNDFEEMKKWLQSLYQQWREQPESLLNTNLSFEKYSRKKEAEQLASSLLALVAN